MPSPFPGMDPFLEHPRIYPMLHSSMIVYMVEALQSRLPEPYFAVSDERLWVETEERLIEPDVDVLLSTGVVAEETNGNVAVATPARTQPVVIVHHDEQRETFIEIRVREYGNESVVTTVELLSWTNKTPGEKGMELYVQKQREILGSRRINLVEIDLLRGGQHVAALPRDVILAKAGNYDYHTCVHRFDKLKKFYVYPTKLEESLPEIAIPLLPRDGSVPLDLQAVFDRCYDAGPYRRRVRYDVAELVPPIEPEREAWVNERLQGRH